MGKLLSKFKLVFLVVALPLILSACAGNEGNAGGYSVEYADYTGKLAYTEVRINDTAMVWPALSIDATFCVFEGKNDPRFLNAVKWRDEQKVVTIHYSTINAGDKEGYNSLQGNVGCDPEAEGVQTYRLESIRLAASETEASPTPAQ